MSGGGSRPQDSMTVRRQTKADHRGGRGGGKMRGQAWLPPRGKFVRAGLVNWVEMGRVSPKGEGFDNLAILHHF